MCELPDVKFENFVAAKACLQKTLVSLGGIAERLAINEDQNGKKVWRVQISAQGTFPRPQEKNFVAVRAVLNQHVPRRGVLRSITLDCDMGPTPSWRWEVSYGIQKPTRLQRAIKSLVVAAKSVSCLEMQPVASEKARHAKRLSSFDTEQQKRRYFYELRNMKKSARVNNMANISQTQNQKISTPPKSVKSSNVHGDTRSTAQEKKQKIKTPPKSLESSNVHSDTRNTAQEKKTYATVAKNQAALKQGALKTDSCHTPLPSRTEKKQWQSDKHLLVHAKGQPFVKGETIPGTYTATPPNYEQWAIKEKLYRIQKPDIELAVALRVIKNCKCKTPNTYFSLKDHQEHGWAISVVKRASESIRACDISSIYEEVKDRLGINEEYLQSFSIKETLQDRISLTNLPHNGNTKYHVLCV